MVSWMNLCFVDNLGFSETSRPTASNFQWTPPIKSLPSPTLSTLPQPLSFLNAHTFTHHASAMSFVLYWSIFPGLHTSVHSVMWAAMHLPRIHDQNLFDFNQQIFSLSGLNCTLIGGGLCRHAKGALLRHKAISWYVTTHVFNGVFPSAGWIILPSQMIAWVTPVAYFPLGL